MCIRDREMMVHYLRLYGEAKRYKGTINKFYVDRLKKDSLYTPDMNDWLDCEVRKIKIVCNPYLKAVLDYMQSISNDVNATVSFEEWLAQLDNSRDHRSLDNNMSERGNFDQYIHHFLKFEELETELLSLDKILKTRLYDSYLAIKGDGALIHDNKTCFYVGNRRADFFRQSKDKSQLTVPDYSYFYGEIETDNQTTRRRVEKLWGRKF